MSDETAAPETLPTPTNDAQAAAQEALKAPVDNPDGAVQIPEQKAHDDEERKRNRTGAFIDRLKTDNASLRAEQQALRDELARYTKQQEAAPGPQATAKPTLEECGWDIEKHTEAVAIWAARTERERYIKESRQEAAKARAEQVQQTYSDKAADFAQEHPDFQEVIGTIKYPISKEVEAAILAHPNGPEIAYHIGLNDDDAFQLAAVVPHMAVAAVQRLAARLTAAPSGQQQTPKPISQAPPPAPRVTSRSPMETPQEKMTDDQWYEKERGRRRKG